MLTKAIVVSVDGRLMGKVVRSEACQACHACDFGQKEEVLVDLPQGAYREGEEVELSLADNDVTLAALIAYGLPLLMFIAGLLAGGPLFDLLGWPRELGQGLCALLLTLAAYLAIRRMERRFRKSRRFVPRACPKDARNSSALP